MLGTGVFSSLSHALRRASGVRFVRLLIESLETRTLYRRGDLVGIDSMAVTIGRNRRHNCHKYNNHAVGGGVLWSYQIKSKPGTCPVRLLQTMQGAWHDSKLMRHVGLQSDGPVYLMDRGFYCIDQISHWLSQKVRFIVRVKAQCLIYDVVRILSGPRKLGRGWNLESDQIVLLGSRSRTHRPKVRLIVAVSPKGEKFIYATSENDWDSQQVVDSYKLRWHIERFHRFLKNSIGLAHLYSFHALGLEFLILTALLTAMLLFTGAKPAANKETIQMLYAALKQMRRQIGIPPPWKRNTLAVKRSSGRQRGVSK